MISRAHLMGTLGASILALAIVGAACSYRPTPPPAAAAAIVPPQADHAPAPAAMPTSKPADPQMALQQADAALRWLRGTLVERKSASH